jgi:hypothetical protein
MLFAASALGDSPAVKDLATAYWQS